MASLRTMSRRHRRVRSDQDETESPGGGFSRWARMDSNQGPTDYELGSGPREAESPRELLGAQSSFPAGGATPRISACLGLSLCHSLATSDSSSRRRARQQDDHVGL